MERKKWTHRVEVNESLLKFREKRKWQVALRRYVLEKNLSSDYAFYFGLSIIDFREWTQLQFTEGLSWNNFGISWQFEHLVPVTYFDFSNKEDLALCWNFMNIRVEPIENGKRGGNRINIFSIKPYFEKFYAKTGYSLCLKMIEKIKLIENINIINESALENFINNKKGDFEVHSTLTKDEFNNLNSGRTLKDILLEREIIKKFG